MSERAQRLLEYADDELILGWRDSEWTGIAPSLEEDVAFSSIAQNEIGHARALYELAARDLGTTADELAFDRSPDEYRCAPLVELRQARLGAHDRAPLAVRDGRRAAPRRAEGVRRRRGRGPRGEDGPRGGLPPPARADVGRPPARRAAFPRSRRRAVAVRRRRARQGPAPGLAQRLNLPSDTLSLGERGDHSDELRELWEEMTMVRRSVPGATW